MARATLRIAAALAAAGLFASGGARAGERACREPTGTRIWWSPLSPAAGSPLRILVVSEDVRKGEIHIALPGQPSRVGSRPASPAADQRGKEWKPSQGFHFDERLTTSVRGGPPFSFAAEVKPSAAGNLRVELLADGEPIACRRISVQARGHAIPPARPETPGAWRATQEWSRDTENLFSAWIERMFDAPADASLGFPSLAPVLHDPARNFLWGHLGLREDDPKNRDIPRAVPDCADLPYYLRAYFAWKLALPFALRDCDRGKTDRPPKCGPILHNETADENMHGHGVLEHFRSFLRVLANQVHSGSARTALDDNETDFYPVALTRSALRPGTIYADPYGHVLMVVAWVDQTPEHGGLLFAVDGQPDNSVGRKRFWEGTFLFASDIKSAGPGFKAFRPIVRGPDKMSTWEPSKGSQTLPRSGSAGQSPASPTRLSTWEPSKGSQTLPRSGSAGQSPASPTRLSTWEPSKGSQTLPRSGSAGQSPASPTRLSTWEPSKGSQTLPRSGSAGQSPASPTRLYPLPNSALSSDRRFAPFSVEQAKMDRETFYARVAKLVNPAGLDARAAYAETMNALLEQLTTRVGSVDNGERFMRDKHNPVVPMPYGPKIFETAGPWEDYATPSRDMRLLIALRVLTGLPARIALHPELFVLGGRKPAEVKSEIEALHEKQIHERAIEYRRSDGSTFRLTVADILARRPALEMAYNPNDCIEIRWGASEGSSDFATCGRHAPEEQRARMQEYRAWFRSAQRPPR